jgi:F-type H+/Na+-transporting ATPase subunit alpha
LDRGRRMVEILKQPQYQPMDVFDQVVSIFAGASGLLDNIDVHHIAAFEKQMHEYLKTNNSELLTELRSRGEMSDEFKSRLTAAIREFERTFEK